MVENDTPAEQDVQTVPQLLIQLQNADVDIVPVPGTEGAKLMLVGPILVKLALPLNSEAANAIAGALTGSQIVVAPAGALGALKT